ERRERLEDAVAVLEGSPGRLEHARALIDLGATLRGARQRTPAREPLLHGLELAARCGGRTLEGRTRSELAAIGIRPRATDRTGTDSLPPRARRGGDLPPPRGQT